MKGLFKCVAVPASFWLYRLKLAVPNGKGIQEERAPWLTATDPMAVARGARAWMELANGSQSLILNSYVLISIKGFRNRNCYHSN